MKNLKIKGAFVSILILLTLTLAACGSVKDDVQGKWQLEENNNIKLNIKDKKMEMVYKKKIDGVTKKNVLKGELLEEKDDYILCTFEGFEEKGKLKVKDGTLLFDKKKYEKVDK